MQNNLHVIACALAISAATQSQAQKIFPPSPTVFKCESGGKVLYSDAPCLGGKRIEVVPDRGLNKETGAERIGEGVCR